MEALGGPFRAPRAVRPANWPGGQESPRFDARFELLTSVLSLCYVPIDMMSGVKPGRDGLRVAQWLVRWMAPVPNGLDLDAGAVFWQGHGGIGPMR